MAIKKSKCSIHITLDKRIIEAMDGSIEEINKEGEKEMDFNKVTRSSFISTLLISFINQCIPQEKENKKDA